MLSFHHVVSNLCDAKSLSKSLFKISSHAMEASLLVIGLQVSQINKTHNVTNAWFRLYEFKLLNKFKGETPHSAFG